MTSPAARGQRPQEGWEQDGPGLGRRWNSVQPLDEEEEGRRMRHEEKEEGRGGRETTVQWKYREVLAGAERHRASAAREEHSVGPESGLETSRLAVSGDGGGEGVAGVDADSGVRKLRGYWHLAWGGGPREAHLASLGRAGLAMPPHGDGGVNRTPGAACQGVGDSGDTAAWAEQTVEV